MGIGGSQLIAEKESLLAERDRLIAVRDAELSSKTLQIEHLKARMPERPDKLAISCSRLS